MFAMPRLTPRTAAKWIGSMPTLVTIGSKRGAESRRPLISSITIPIRIITMLTIKRMMIGFSETEKTSALASPGMSSKIRKRLTITTMKTIIMTTPIVTEASRIAGQKFLRSSPR